MPRPLAMLLSVIILVVGVIAWVPLFREKTILKQHQFELQDKLQAQRAMTRDLEARIHAVRTDPAFVERLAREKFGLARPGETVFKFRTHPAPGWVPSGPPARTGP